MGEQIFTLANLPTDRQEFTLIHNGYKFLAEYTDRTLIISNTSGTTYICEQDIQDISQESTKLKINKILTKVVDGFEVCACCRKPMDKNEIGLKIYAGVYCNECTTPELKKIANSN